MTAPAPGIDGYRTPRATCLLAPNPSPMTLDGTNTWLIAEPGSSSVVVVDPGPDDEDHLGRVHAEAVAGDRRVARILLTHGHPDHSAGAARFAALTGAPVQAADPAHRLGPEGLADGDVVTAAGCELRVVASPGHSADSVCLLLPADGALFTGDTVLGRGTTVIAGDGNLGDYLRTLGQLRDLAESSGIGLLLPGHGPMLANPLGTLDYYLSHRQERLDQVRSALAAGARTPAEIVAMIYTDVDRSVWPAAEWSVRAQLDYLGRGATMIMDSCDRIAPETVHDHEVQVRGSTGSTSSPQLLVSLRPWRIHVTGGTYRDALLRVWMPPSCRWSDLNAAFKSYKSVLGVGFRGCGVHQNHSNHTAEALKQARGVGDHDHVQKWADDPANCS